MTPVQDVEPHTKAMFAVDLLQTVVELKSVIRVGEIVTTKEAKVSERDLARVEMEQDLRRKFS
jgi:hypothetical protein